jgi:hypothetical protein
VLWSSFDISEFFRKVEGHSRQEIIYLADKEATATERYIYKQAKGCKKRSDDDPCRDARHYALQLKDFVLYIRYGVLTHSVRMLNLTLPGAP